MRERWSNPSVVLHWLAAFLLLGLAAAGFILGDLPRDSGARLILSRMHTLGGATLMLLTLARLWARWRGGAMQPLPLPALHRRGVGAVHALLYVVTFGIGLSGFVMGATTTWPNYLGGAQAEPPSFKEVPAHEAHELLVFAALGLVALHVGGVIVQELRKGGALRRMVPFLK